MDPLDDLDLGPGRGRPDLVGDHPDQPEDPEREGEHPSESAPAEQRERVVLGLRGPLPGDDRQAHARLHGLTSISVSTSGARRQVAGRFGSTAGAAAPSSVTSATSRVQASSPGSSSTHQTEP